MRVSCVTSSVDDISATSPFAASMQVLLSRTPLVVQQVMAAEQWVDDLVRFGEGVLYDCFETASLLYRIATLVSLLSV